MKVDTPHQESVGDLMANSRLLLHLSPGGSLLFDFPSRNLMDNAGSTVLRALVQTFE